MALSTCGRQPHTAGKSGPSNDHQRGRITQLSLGTKTKEYPWIQELVTFSTRPFILGSNLVCSKKIKALQATYLDHAGLGLRMVSSMRFIPSPRAAAKVVKDVSDEGITEQGKAQMGCNKPYSTDSTTWP